MINLAKMNRVLPVVADDWASLRKSDVYRLMSALNYDSADELREAGSIVSKQRSDLDAEVRDCVNELIEERFAE